jgi:hypothetical protein
MKNTISLVCATPFNFSGREAPTNLIPAAGVRPNAAARVAGGSICMTAEDLKKCFDPVVNEVIKLVKWQISGIKGSECDVSAVLLVGGFGQSRYLKKRLEDAIAPINLLCPPNG